MNGVTELPAATPASGPLTRRYLACSVHPQATGNFCMWLRVPAGASELGTPWGGTVRRERAPASVGGPVDRRGPWAAAELPPSFPPQAGWLRARGGTGLGTLQDSRALVQGWTPALTPPLSP
ncbi:unnamed protein product [Rangifer tarandus platyrhynchus]|uniref:Uncharacterized protein n=1 Tax=Rangifer tarandus platyrhynchus TaxID=3082113 RepID=A0ABN8Y1J3_RANTA|nr:unnamed protein product [Rangifer tarandus platyrhynchus]